MKVAAVVLAAGKSRRLGRPKQRLKREGKTLLVRAVEAAQDGGCSQVVVVLGHDAESLAADLPSRQVEIVRNEEWARGVAGSIRIGLSEVARGQAEAVLFLTCDQPYLDASIVRRLLDASLRSPHSIVAAEYAEIRGVPAIFPRGEFGALSRLQGDRGARALIDAARSGAIGVAWPDGAVDIDTETDWLRFQAERNENV